MKFNVYPDGCGNRSESYDLPTRSNSVAVHTVCGLHRNNRNSPPSSLLNLPFTKRSLWIHRWLVLPSWNRLHRVRSVDDRRRFLEWKVGDGETLCGRRGSLAVPGFMSRLGLPRCAHCCRLAGVPRGVGAPMNQQIDL